MWGKERRKEDRGDLNTPYVQLKTQIISLTHTGPTYLAMPTLPAVPAAMFLQPYSYVDLIWDV